MAMPDAMSDKKPEPQHKGPKEKPMTKVVIRRLPPNMNDETFLNQIAPVPEHDYFYMVKGDASLKEHSFARAYINFVNPEEIFDFTEKFDNYVFVDDRGHEYPAVVEYAPFQKIPKKRNKNRMDPKCGTIESDPYYLEFVESLNKEPEEQEEKPEFSYQINTDEKSGETTTPLLEFVKQRKAEKLKIREERREERKRKDFERKKFRDDERRRRDDKSPVRNNRNQYPNKTPKETAPKEEGQDTDNSKSEESKTKSEVQEENAGKEPHTIKEEAREKYDKNASTSSTYYRGRNRKYDDRSKKDTRSKYPPKKEYHNERREFKNQRRDDYKKYDEYKKDDTKTTYQNRKVKKYSEKREERKIEAQKATEQKKQDQESKEDSSRASESAQTQENANKNETTKSNPPKDVGAGDAGPRQTERHRDRETESQSRRIRNKDRPTIAIYRPGMLSKKKHSDGDSETKERKD